MSHAKRVLLTGATGYIGSHLAARLLRDGHHVSAIARGCDGVSAEQRVMNALHAAGASSCADLDVYDGDIKAPQAGLAPRTLRHLERSIDEVWSCAASLSFLDTERDDIFAMNVGGTRNLLELAKRTAGPRFHHVSTAYIAGNRTGTVHERDIDVGQAFRNPYEASKCAAEMLVADAQRRGEIAATVYRPSVVVGDSTSGRATHFHGVYPFIRAINALADRYRGRRGAHDVELPLRVPGDPAATLNLVPIDFVVEAMIALGLRDESAGATYHVTNPDATENRMWLEAVCEELGVRGVELASPCELRRSTMNRLEAAVQKQLTFHTQYLNGEPRFDCSGALAALAASNVRCPRMSPELLRMLARWYVTRLKAEASNAPRIPNGAAKGRPVGECAAHVRNASERIAAQPAFASAAAPAAVLLDAFSKHGNSPHALVSLSPASIAWHRDDGSGVAYVQRGRVWLAAADPIAPKQDRAAVAQAFAAAASEGGRLPVFVPSTEGFARSMLAEGWTCLKIGAAPYFELPVWDPRGNIARHLRSSVNRATKCGITVEIAQDVEALHEELDRVCAGWLKTRPAGTSFGWLFALNPLLNAQHKRFFVARDRRKTIVGMLAASPIAARSGWYLEDVVRSPDSPIGVCDALVHGVLRQLQQEGFQTATLGTALLARDGDDLTPPGDWIATRRNLQTAKRLLAGFYNFDGLHSFKSKFVPTRWEAEYVVVPDAGNATQPLRIAFAAIRAIMPSGVWPMFRHLATNAFDR